MKTIAYLAAAVALIAFAVFVFRRIVLRDYLKTGRLTILSSVMQLMVFAGFFGLPYLYNPPGWDMFWRLDDNIWHRAVGFVLIASGSILVLGTMGWFGLRRALGLEVKGLIRAGPYRFSRNPQLVCGYLLIIGVAVQHPSWYALGWVLIYSAIGHLMILGEEEHLQKVSGEEYTRFCQEVPRYLNVPFLRQESKAK